MSDLKTLPRKVAKLRERIAAEPESEEGQVAKALLAALLEAHPDLDVEEEEQPTVEVVVGVLCRWEQAILAVVGEHLAEWGVSVTLRRKSWGYKGPEWACRFAVDLYRKHVEVLHQRLDLVTGALMHASFPEAAKRMSAKADKGPRSLSFEEIALVSAAQSGLHRAPTPARLLPAPEGAETEE